jgi:hypothetical protein
VLGIHNGDLEMLVQQLEAAQHCAAAVLELSQDDCATPMHGEALVCGVAALLGQAAVLGSALLGQAAVLGSALLGQAAVLGSALLGMMLTAKVQNSAARCLLQLELGFPVPVVF